MILASLDGGFVGDCISIFEHMKDHCAPNVGTINAMLKVYTCADMFAKAKELFEATKATHGGLESSGDYSSLQLDSYSYKSMLEASASSQQWEYFEYVYKEMILSGFQLDHRKYSWLLVKASRAGKWHLLEHAFDTILEAEEIPHTSLFTEMICQTITQGDFGRTVSLLNSMAHASLSVSESQWTSLLEREIATLGMGKLQDLLNHLQSCSLVMEDPVPNILKSLDFISGRRLLEGTGSCTRTESVAGSIGNLESDGKNQDYQHVDVPGRVDGRLPSLSLTSNSCNLFEMLDAESSANASLQEEIDNLGSQHSCFEPNEESYFTDSTLDLLTSGIRIPFSELPPASEILERWRTKQED
ncbi:pentatricopeptide repeat-containing protein At5g67570, chloroplastic-like [Curcuma longa]|uniref:pentatricopeptide repeat-containing protein At5g67570, chloroplastic-like n=1 Tax=Curcuma longa TaxID=136217 RepID=UPI003D9F4279